MPSSFETPFPEKTKKHAFERHDFETASHTNIRELPSRGDKIIRMEPMGDEGVDEALERIKTMKALYADIAAHGMSIPDFDVVIGKNERGKKSIISVVDKIEGERVSMIEDHDPVLIDRLDEFFAAYLRYVADARRERHAFYGDMSDLQLIYGHPKDETEKNVYLVDVGFNNFVWPDKEGAATGRPGFNDQVQMRIGFLMAAVENMQKRLPGAEFSKTGAAIEEIKRSFRNET